MAFRTKAEEFPADIVKPETSVTVPSVEESCSQCKNDADLRCKLPVIANESFKKFDAFLSTRPPSFDNIESVGNLKYLTNIAIGISNVCNYSNRHPQCPVHHMKSKDILPSELVYKILDELAEYGYKGGILFQWLNEPMIDPRLFLFIKYAREKMPEARIVFNTNGYWVTKEMMDELIDIGLTALYTTAYTIKEYDRLKEIESDLPHLITPVQFVDFLGGYTNEDNIIPDPCYAPFSEATIDHYGNLILYCRDYKSKYKFGNIKDCTLKELFSKNQGGGISGIPGVIFRNKKNRFMPKMRIFKRMFEFRFGTSPSYT